jgi:hypothetical protein
LKVCHSEVGTMPITLWSPHISWYSWHCSDLH